MYLVGVYGLSRREVRAEIPSNSKRRTAVYFGFIVFEIQPSDIYTFGEMRSNI